MDDVSAHITSCHRASETVARRIGLKPDERSCTTARSSGGMPETRCLRLRGSKLAIALALSLSLAACSSTPSGSAHVTITLYNGQHVQTTDALVAAFEKQTGIEVAVRNDDEDIFDAEIVAEGPRSPADVIYTENSPALEYLQQKRLLAPVDRSTLARTPSEYNSPQGDWVGISARVSVIIYNPGLIARSALPDHVLQLADPRYRGELALAAGETDFQPIVTSVLRAYGKARALGLAGGRQGQCGKPCLSRQRDDSERGEPRRRRLRRGEPVLLVPDAGRDRCLQHPLRDRLLRAP